eukprot:1157535-Pelagomonas_calceolata.AAC.2
MGPEPCRTASAAAGAAGAAGALGVAAGAVSGRGGADAVAAAAATAARVRAGPCAWSPLPGASAAFACWLLVPAVPAAVGLDAAFTCKLFVAAVSAGVGLDQLGGGSEGARTGASSSCCPGALLWGSVCKQPAAEPRRENSKARVLGPPFSRPPKP